MQIRSPFQLLQQNVPTDKMKGIHRVKRKVINSKRVGCRDYLLLTIIKFISIKIIKVQAFFVANEEKKKRGMIQKKYE